MPYSAQHSCRIREPALFNPDSFRTLRTKTKGLTIIIGILKKTDKSALQAYRYAKKDWQSDRASKHCDARGGRFEPAAVKKNCELSVDHSFLHLIWSKVKDSVEWKGWKKEDLLLEHAKITDELRKMGYSMIPKTSLDILSKEKEITVASLTSANISHFLKSKDTEDDSSIEKSFVCELSDQDLFTELSLFDEIDSMSNFISLSLSDDNKLIISIRSEKEDTKLEEELLLQFPEKLRKQITFSYSLKGPDSSFIPLYDLVLKPKKLEMFSLQ